MDENVPETGHRREPGGKRFGQDLVRSKHFEEFSIIRGQIQTQVRDDVVADIEHALDGELEVSFRIAINQRIFEERPFIVLPVDLAK